jgi:hypothetical protein
MTRTGRGSGSSVDPEAVHLRVVSRSACCASASDHLGPTGADHWRMQRDPDGHCLYRLRVNGDQGCDEQTMDPGRLRPAGTEPVFALQKVQAISRRAT